MTQTAVQLALDAEPEEPFGAAEQFDLLGLGENAASQLQAELQAARSRDKKRGRPPGARNKQTLEWAEYLSRRYTHPLETLAAIQATGIDELAARLGCTKLEALQEKRVAAAMLLPYLAKKMPIAVNVNGKILHLNMLVDGEELPLDQAIELAPPDAPAPAPDDEGTG